ncbi:hypothetical protein [Actinomadura alba]|uniref:SWIM-type domain-containing protein n=1 Tax=Actinomadura alba TaxID=406431 RepID=A0ABR7LTS6_9ACTN|nr:hypothetical protein [Actinomadura alba]MBC6467803.1 hypothetical protein [Actinomadura alba]
MIPTRGDLLALTPDALAALANRGLVKRAAKELDAGAAPEVEHGENGTVRGRFPDDVETTLPARAGLDGASCTCAATGVCRHQIGLILAYQRQAAQAQPTAPMESTEPMEGTAPKPLAEVAAPASPAQAIGVAPPDWSPGAFDDDALAGVLGERAVAAARRTHRAGYAARIHRPTAADPVASVELPTCTVRFLVPGELGYVHTDAIAAIRGEVIALAVWSFRAADELGAFGADVRIDVGGGADRATVGSGLEAALSIVDQVLLDGAMHAGPVVATALIRAGRELTGNGLHWPAAALDDLAGQLTAYRERDAGYDPGRFAELLTEVHARHRAGRHEGGSPRSQVLGTDESTESPLRRVRLVSLGCRVGGTDARRSVGVYLAHAGSGIVLVLKRAWEVADGEIVTGHDLATRRIAGSALREFAAANIVSETASRSASRVVRLAAGRVAKSTITPLGAAWEHLPDTVLVRDLRALGAMLGALPPRLIRPRVEAELVRVIEIAEVRDIGYDPGGQRLEAVIADQAGTTAVMSAAYNPYCPGALDRLASALSGEHGDPLYLSGSVRRVRGTVELDPIAVMTADGVASPDLAPGDGDAALMARTEQRADPLSSALETALATCAEAAHRGLRHVPAGFHARIGQSVSELDKAGLRTAAGLLTELGAVLGGDDTGRMADAWVNAQLRLLTTAELS